MEMLLKMELILQKWNLGVNEKLAARSAISRPTDRRRKKQSALIAHL